jgi:hypothetical protein
MERSKEDMSLKNPVTPPGIDPGTVLLVTQRLNQYASPGPLYRGPNKLKDHRFKSGGTKLLAPADTVFDLWFN